MWSVSFAHITDYDILILFRLVLRDYDTNMDRLHMLIFLFYNLYKTKSKSDNFLCTCRENNIVT